MQSNQAFRFLCGVFCFTFIMLSLSLLSLLFFLPGEIYAVIPEESYLSKKLAKFVGGKWVYQYALHTQCTNGFCFAKYCFNVWSAQPTCIRQNCIWICFQLWAKGDAQLRRGRHEGLVLPSKLISGTQSLKNLVAGSILKSKEGMTRECTRIPKYIIRAQAK